MISGSHVIIYSTDAEADRHFFRDVLAMPNVDVGEGWLIFSLPPSELGIHPSSTNSVHQFYLMCESLDEFIAKMQSQAVPCTQPHEEPWGIMTDITLPGGGVLGVYQAYHSSPP